MQSVSIMLDYTDGRLRSYKEIATNFPHHQERSPGASLQQGLLC
jgi:hypothetical protein